MSRSPHQKLKLLYLYEYFLKYTDEDHPVTIKELIAHLAKYDIPAERKSIYDDIDALRYFGLDIIQCSSSRYATYYLGSRDFELPELKLMVDSIQTSKFVTQKKTLTLIKKIENLASIYDAQLLQRQVFVSNRIKHMNESIYYNVDKIHSAINQNLNIKFHYFDYNIKKEQHLRRNGEFYTVSPYAMTWDDENYYLIAYDPEAAIIKHFRVDKMLDISLLNSTRAGEEAYKNLDMGLYSKRVFSMFTGDVTSVELRFENRLVGAVLDRFGKDIPILEDGSDHFRCRVDVAVSPQFFAWVFGFGSAATILSPDTVVKQMSDQLQAVSKQYSS